EYPCAIHCTERANAFGQAHPEGSSEGHSNLQSLLRFKDYQMKWLDKVFESRERGAALLIVLAFVVLLTGISVAYLSRTTSDRQVAHSSFNQSNVDQLAQSAMDNIIGDIRQEVINGSTAVSQADGTTVYAPTALANMVPQRSGNAAGAPHTFRGRR